VRVVSVGKETGKNCRGDLREGGREGGREGEKSREGGRQGREGGREGGRAYLYRRQCHILFGCRGGTERTIVLCAARGRWGRRTGRRKGWRAG